jgi:hypothetical protein
MQKKILVAALVSTVLAANASAAQLPDYTAVQTALLNGKSIHYVVDFTKCKTTSPEAKALTNAAVFEPNEMILAPDHIATSLNHFTLDDPSYPDKPIYEFIKYTLDKDGTLLLGVQDLNAVDFSMLGNGYTVTCKMNDGLNVFD